jgi:peptidoglycan/LPS O-acetylase OafA/YrhL
MTGIESLRFFSALSVLIFHYKNLSYEGLTRFQALETSYPFYDWLWPLYVYGDYGVQIFWCISGFIFFWKYQGLIANRLISGQKFFVWRFSRLYPLHVVTLVYVALLQWAYTQAYGESFACSGNDVFHFVLHLFMASNWRGQWGLTFNAPIWSVSVEVLVYALFFVMLRLGLRSIAASAAVTLACVLARHWGVDNRVLSCIGFFYAGGMVALINQAVMGKAAAQSYRWIMTALLLLGPIVFFLNFFHHGHGNGELLFLNLWIPVLIHALVNWNVSEQGTLAKVLESAGNMTYASYLLHFPIQLTIAFIYVAHSGQAPVNSPVLMVSYLAVTLVASVFVYQYFEMPMQNRIRLMYRGSNRV